MFGFVVTCAFTFGCKLGWVLVLVLSKKMHSGLACQAGSSSKMETNAQIRVHLLKKCSDQNLGCSPWVQTNKNVQENHTNHRVDVMLMLFCLVFIIIIINLALSHQTWWVYKGMIYNTDKPYKIPLILNPAPDLGSKYRSGSAHLEGPGTGRL